MTRHAGGPLSHESRGCRAGLLAANQQPSAPDRINSSSRVRVGSAVIAPLAVVGQTPPQPWPGPGWRAARPASAARSVRPRPPAVRRRRHPPPPWYRVASLWAPPTPATRHPDGPPRPPPGSPAPVPGLKEWQAPPPISSRPLSSCSSSPKLTTSARAMASRTTGSISAGLPHTSGLRLGSRSRPAPRRPGWSPWLAGNCCAPARWRAQWSRSAATARPGRPADRRGSEN